ncbi:hypothetical protein RDI58_011223 [Solanum bulbocastanum]|uniref:Uncharacterized protein n=1 Tax=Solanum bulbocastanum TaxID=147425 RepID=A0AAN8TW48_SOLBU
MATGEGGNASTKRTEVQSLNATVDHDKNLVNQEMGDDDNLILHVLAGANDRTTMVKDSIQEAMTAIQASEDFVDQEMDDDDENIVINVVDGAKDRNTMFKDPTLEAITAIQNSLSKESRLATDIQKEGRTMPSNRSVKHLQRLKMVRHILCCLKLKQSNV